MRMNKDISSALSYTWAWVCGLFAWVPGISPDWWTVIIGGVGMVITAAINWHWQKKTFQKRFKKERMDEQSG
jgi:hypothetical protein